MTRWFLQLHWNWCGVEASFFLHAYRYVYFGGTKNPWIWLCVRTKGFQRGLFPKTALTIRDAGKLKNGTRQTIKTTPSRKRGGLSRVAFATVLEDFRLPKIIPTLFASYLGWSNCNVSKTYTYIVQQGILSKTPSTAKYERSIHLQRTASRLSR